MIFSALTTSSPGEQQHRGPQRCPGHERSWAASSRGDSPAVSHPPPGSENPPPLWSFQLPAPRRMMKTRRTSLRGGKSIKPRALLWGRQGGQQHLQGLPAKCSSWAWPTLAWRRSTGDDRDPRDAWLDTAPSLTSFLLSPWRRRHTIGPAASLHQLEEKLLEVTKGSSALQTLQETKIILGHKAPPLGCPSHPPKPGGRCWHHPSWVSPLKTQG